MLAVVILSALLGLALGDPLPPIKKHTQIIHVPAPKPQVVRVPALQEHAVRQVQHVPIRQTVVRHVNVPKNIIREVPVIVEKQLILRQPQIRKFPIDVKKTILQPYVKPVPQVRVNYRKRPYDVWHTRVQKKYINVPRPVPVIKHKIVTKVLNRIVDVPHKVYKDKVKVVRVPQPFKVQKVHQRKIDVPVVVQVPVPRVRVKQTQEIQNVPIDVTVVRKVGIPKKTTLTEIVPVPVKHGGGYPQKFDDSDGGAAGHLGAGLNQAAYFGSIDAPYSDNSFFGGEFAGAQAQAQAHVLAQAQNYAHAQANINGDSLHNDLELANQLAYSDNYGKEIGKLSSA